MLGFLKNNSWTVHPQNEDQIDEQEMSAIMFTVSSSNFKLVILLHYPSKANLPPGAWSYIGLNAGDDERIYSDYVCELGNNFCGVICRVIGAAGLSTGMSTPVILHNAHSSLHLRRIGADCEKHFVAKIPAGPLFCASAFLSVNQGMSKDLDIPIPSVAAKDENLGELEFF